MFIVWCVYSVVYIYSVVCLQCGVFIVWCVYSVVCCAVYSVVSLVHQPSSSICLWFRHSNFNFRREPRTQAVHELFSKRSKPNAFVYFRIMLIVTCWIVL